MSTDSPRFDIFLEVLRVLEDLNAPYVIIGAFAGSLFGIQRTTLDIDIVVALSEPHIQGLVRHFPLPRYYADPEQMRNCTRQGIMFNIIDTSMGDKADLLPVTMNSHYPRTLRRRVRRRYSPPDQPTSAMEVWCARPADIIIGKLQAWTEGRSRKHETDIYEMLVFHYLGANPDLPLDESEVENMATQLGRQTHAFWQAVTKAAREEAVRIQQAPPPAWDKAA